MGSSLLLLTVEAAPPQRVASAFIPEPPKCGALLGVKCQVVLQML